MDEKALEEAARAIYDRMPYDGPTGTIKPPWVEGGNSLKQEEARRYADAAITAYERATWQPIEECPDEVKDGETWVWGYWPVDFYEDRQTPTRWSKNENRWMDAADNIEFCQPTHFRHLPPPPKGEG